MKLSLSMLAWFLRDYHPITNINQDSISITGLRFLMEERMDIQPDYLYIGQTGQYFSDPRYSKDHFVINNMGNMIFHDCSFEELMNKLLAAFDFFNNWERRLWEAAGNHVPLQQILDIVQEVLGNQILVTQLDGLVLAVSGYKKDNDIIWQYNVEQGSLHSSVRSNPYLIYGSGNPVGDLRDPVLVTNVYAEGNPVLMQYLLLDRENVGLLCIKQDDPSLTKMDMQLMSYVRRYLVQAEEFTSAHSALRSSVSVVKSLLSGAELDPEVVKPVFSRFQSSWRLAVLKSTVRNDDLFRNSLLNSLETMSAANISLICNHCVISILPQSIHDSVSIRQYSNLRLQYLRIGMSMPCTRPEMLPLCLEQANYVLEHADEKAGVFCCEAYAFDYQIQLLSQNAAAAALISPAFHDLSVYDAKKNTELCNSLKVYLNCGLNQRMAAKELHVHENTLQYRLRRIREITGLDLNDQSVIRYLYLSYWMIEEQNRSF